MDFPFSRTQALGTVLGSTSYNMGTLGFTASGAAAGTWNVCAVLQGGQVGGGTGGYPRPSSDQRDTGRSVTVQFFTS